MGREGGGPASESSPPPPGTPEGPSHPLASPLPGEPCAARRGGGPGSDPPGWAMAEISDLDRQIEQLRRCELIKESEVKALCAKAR